MHQRIGRFSRILKLRENYRETEQTLLAAERREDQPVLDQLFSLEGEKSQAMENFCSDTTQTLSCTELWFQRQFIASLDDHIDAGKESLYDVRQRIAGTEARLVERHRDVKVMETYVDGLKAEARRIGFETEQLELDDIAMMRFSRMRQGGEL